jgi:hypothetical protein
MRRRFSRVLLAVAALVCGTAVPLQAGQGAVASSPNWRNAAVVCPEAQPLTAAEGPTTASAVLAALRSAVPRVYRNLGRDSIRGYQVLALFSLSGQWSPEPRFFLRARSRIAARCGSLVAGRSWAALIHFPRCHRPCSQSIAFFARQRGRWTLWHRV